MSDRPHQSRNKQLESRYRALERQEIEREESKNILRTQLTWLSRRELESLYENSNRYPEWQRQFIDSIENLRANGIHSAKDFEGYFAKRKFRTLGGLPLSAHIIDCLREKYRVEGKMHRPTGQIAQPESDIKKKIGKHRSHFMYKPIPSSDDDTD